MNANHKKEFMIIDFNSQKLLKELKEYRVKLEI